jgi:hypothetical protein
VLGGYTASVDGSGATTEGSRATADGCVRTAADGCVRAAAERRAFLAEYLAVGPATRSGSRRAAPDSTGGSAGRSAAAEAARSSAATGGMTAQTRSARNGGSRRLGSRVATQRVAVTGQHGVAAFAADAQPCAARPARAGLTADTDAAERARNMRRCGAVDCGALTSDQPRLTARAHAECGIPAGTRDTTGVARQTTGSSAAGLSAQATAGTKAGLACEPSLAAQTGLGTDT